MSLGFTGLRNRMTDWGRTPSTEKLTRLTRRLGYAGFVLFHPDYGYEYRHGAEVIRLGNDLTNARRAIAQWPKR